MDDKEKIAAQIDYYVRLVIKKRWFIIIPFCLSMLMGIYFAITLPKIFSASNLILVVPKSVPDRYVPSVVVTDIQDRINTIRQQIMSRSNLERLISDLNLFAGPQNQSMYMIDKVEAIRKSTSIQVTQSRGGIDSFTIEFMGRDPEKVMQVVNRLADSFINESVVIMEGEIIDTNQFLIDELSHLNKRLKEIEASIQEYRRNHMGALPEELSSNLATITRLQLQLSEKQENLRDARNRLVALDSRMSMMKSNTSDLLSSLSDDVFLETTEFEEEDQQLSKLKEGLKALRTKYTENHPDVVRIKSMIATLETQKAQEESEKEDKPVEPEPEQDLSASFAGTMDFGFGAQQDELKREIDRYIRDIDKIESQIEEYQSRVENTPQIKHELMALERVHANLQDQYNQFLQRKLESDIAVSMERKQKGQKFRVLDSARLPQKPVSPDVKKLLALCLFAGFAFGGGLIFALDYIDNTLRLPANIETSFGIPVLAILPKKLDRRDRIRYRINHAFSMISLMVGFLLFSVMAVFAVKGVDRTLEVGKNFV